MSRRMRIKIIDEIEFCCKKMKDYYESHNIKFDSADCKMSYEGKMIDVCPFCNTDMEIEVSKSHWGGNDNQARHLAGKDTAGLEDRRCAE